VRLDNRRWWVSGGDPVLPLGDGIRPIAVRFVGAFTALLLGVAGARWEAEAAFAIAITVIERQLESRGA
jgi:hypothetical protein